MKEFDPCSGTVEFYSVRWGKTLTPFLPHGMKLFDTKNEALAYAKQRHGSKVEEIVVQTNKTIIHQEDDGGTA